jgi:hypothetical protein
VRACFRLSGFAEESFALRAGRELFGLFAEAFRFFGKALFKGHGLFETAALHGTISKLTGPNVVFEFRS